MNPFKDKKSLCYYVEEHEEIYVHSIRGWERIGVLTSNLCLSATYAPIEPPPPEGYRNDGFRKPKQGDMFMDAIKGWDTAIHDFASTYYFCAVKIDEKPQPKIPEKLAIFDKSNYDSFDIKYSLKINEIIDYLKAGILDK
jgi:hypothetical protein